MLAATDLGRSASVRELALRRAVAAWPRNKASAPVLAATPCLAGLSVDRRYRELFVEKNEK